jgi:hypothetical protein
MNIVTLIFLFTILNIARLDGILYFEIIKFWCSKWHRSSHHDVKND